MAPSEKPSAQMYQLSAITFLYVLYTSGIRSSVFSLSVMQKLYVPIRSVQPFREKRQMLNIPLRSVHVRYTFLNVVLKF